MEVSDFNQQMTPFNVEPWVWDMHVFRLTYVREYREWWERKKIRAKEIADEQQERVSD